LYPKNLSTANNSCDGGLSRGNLNMKGGEKMLRKNHALVAIITVIALGLSVSFVGAALPPPGGPPPQITRFESLDQFSVSASTFFVGDPVNFEIDVSDDGPAATVDIVFGDSTSDSQEISITGSGTATFNKTLGYTTAGNFTVDVTVTDLNLLTTTGTIQVTIVEPPASCDLGAPASIDPSAEIDESAIIGGGSIIGAFVEIDKQTILGGCVELGIAASVHKNSQIGQETTIGARSEIHKDSFMGERNQIGNDSTVNKNVTTGDDISVGDYSQIHKESSIGSGTTIGNNTEINKNALIGENVSIGSDVLIEKDVTVLDGAVIPDGAIIDKGTTVS
jgi:acetyltransferase-like isoleucine patch superfamily enzyme